MGIIRWYKLKKERDHIKEDINLFVDQEYKLKYELNLLEYDTLYIKKIAQEKFHMVKQDEKIFRVLDRKK